MADMDSVQLDWTAEELRRAVQSAGVAIWAWTFDDDTFLMDAMAYQMWDVSRTDVLTFEDLSAKIHPADRDRVRTAFSRCAQPTGHSKSIFVS